MSDFDEKMRLKGKAEEDRYFAQRDRELIEALHLEQSAESAKDSAREEVDLPPEPREDATNEASARWCTPRSMGRWLRKLTNKVLWR